MTRVPVLFLNNDLKAYHTLNSIAEAVGASVTSLQSHDESVACQVDVPKGPAMQTFVDTLEATGMTTLRLLANRVIVEADTRYKSRRR